MWEYFVLCLLFFNGWGFWGRQLELFKGKTHKRQEIQSTTNTNRMKRSMRHSWKSHKHIQSHLRMYVGSMEHRNIDNGDRLPKMLKAEPTNKAIISDILSVFVLRFDGRDQAMNWRFGYHASTDSAAVMMWLLSCSCMSMMISPIYTLFEAAVVSVHFQTYKELREKNDKNHFIYNIARSVHSKSIYSTVWIERDSWACVQYELLLFERLRICCADSENIAFQIIILIALIDHFDAWTCEALNLFAFLTRSKQAERPRTTAWVHCWFNNRIHSIYFILFRCSTEHLSLQWIQSFSISYRQRELFQFNQSNSNIPFVQLWERFRICICIRKPLE